MNISNKLVIPLTVLGSCLALICCLFLLYSECDAIQIMLERGDSDKRHGVNEDKSITKSEDVEKSKQVGTKGKKEPGFVIVGGIGVILGLAFGVGCMHFKQSKEKNVNNYDNSKDKLEESNKARALIETQLEETKKRLVDKESELKKLEMANTSKGSTEQMRKIEELESTIKELKKHANEQHVASPSKTKPSGVVPKSRIGKIGKTSWKGSADITGMMKLQQFALETIFKVNNELLQPILKEKKHQYVILRIIQGEHKDIKMNNYEDAGIARNWTNENSEVEYLLSNMRDTHQKLVNIFKYVSDVIESSNLSDINPVKDCLQYAIIDIIISHIGYIAICGGVNWKTNREDFYKSTTIKEFIDGCLDPFLQNNDQNSKPVVCIGDKRKNAIKETNKVFLGLLNTYKTSHIYLTSTIFDFFIGHKDILNGLGGCEHNNIPGILVHGLFLFYMNIATSYVNFFKDSGDIIKKSIVA